MSGLGTLGSTSNLLELLKSPLKPATSNTCSLPRHAWFPSSANRSSDLCHTQVVWLC